MTLEALRETAKTMGVPLTEAQMDQFKLYLEDLLLWNKERNLTAITDPEEVVRKHFLDSLSVLKALPMEAVTLIDVGAGAGFPGIPLQIAKPSLEVTLLEATAKKVDFLNHIIERLKLPSAKAVQGRAEECGQNPLYRERFDAAVARAVAPLSTLAEYLIPFAKVGGICIAQKNLSEDVAAATAAISLLGGALAQSDPVTISGLEDRRLVAITKISPTPSEYPRRIGRPSKKPL